MGISARYGKNPLEFLINPVTEETFFNEYHENKYLICSRDEPERYSDLLSIERIDEIISDSELPPAALQMARSKPPIKRRDFSFANGTIDRGAVVRHYQQGATVILPQMHFADAVLYDFCHAMEKQFSSGVQTNIYLTPSGNQGFNTHYDDHDVFVIQIEGEKLWRIYNKPVDNPYRGEAFHSDKFETGDLQEEFILKAGDCVYIPRGLMHDAKNNDDKPSLHITIGIIVKTWADLMLEAMSSVAIRQPDFRKSLPAGYTSSSFDRTAAKKHFKNLIKTFENEVEFEEVFEMFVDNFIRSQGSIVRGGIINASLEIDSKINFRKRPFSQYRITNTETDLVVICAGGDINFKLSQQDNLNKVLSMESFNINDFDNTQTDEAIDMIKKLMAFGLIEKL